MIDKNITTNVNIEKIIKEYIVTNKINIKCYLVHNSKLKMNYKNMSQVEIYKRAKKEFSKLRKNVFINNGENIHVSNSDIKESIAKTIRSIKQKQLLDEHMILFENLDKIIENGLIISSNKEMKNRTQFLYWYYYITLVCINNEEYIVEFDVVLRNNNEKHFRLERIYKIKQVLDRED